MQSGSVWMAGQIVADRYRLEKHLGGGMAAEVWRAHDTKLHAPVAVKLLDAGFAGTPVAARFLREARAAARLRSLHIVQILDQGVHDGAPFIAMELLEGETLAARLDASGPLPPPIALRILGQIGKAVDKAHSMGIVHRDLKPDNVFLVHDEDGPFAKVIDFGIAKVTGPPGEASSTSTASQSLLGTPHYMSPEQVVGERVDHRSDLYALGVVAFECVTGALPFETDDMLDVLELAGRGELRAPSQVAAVPAAFDGWFAKACHRSAAERFESARAMTDALRTCLG